MLRRRWVIGIAGTALAALAAVASTGKVFGAKADAAFKSDTEKASYAIGLNLARQLKTIAADIDERALAQGFNDGRSADRKPRLTDQEITATLASLRKAHQQKLTAAQASAGKPVTSTPGLMVFFKMDPRLTAAYGGDRWVSPPTYTRVGDGNSAVIEARAQVQTRGAVPAPHWTSSDAGVVEVKPDKGSAVTITVKRPGTGNIRITSGELTKELAVQAENRNNGLYVEITQK
jgi:hypothetical protein